MGCRSDYLEPSQLEINLQKVLCLLDELKTGKLSSEYGSGTDDRVYGNASQENLNRQVKKLCSKLQKVDVKKYSLELQMWWRDHQGADLARVREELKSAQEDIDRIKLLKKLSPYEKQLLKIDV